MAAPSGTSWASIINDKGRIGLYVGISNTNTTTTVTIQVWFWSKFGCSDKNNDLYFDNDASSATTLIGPVTIRHSVSSGSGWSTSNQTKLMERTYSYARSSNAQTKYCAVNLKGIDAVGAQMTHSVSYTVPALPSYTVSYNANGGTGAPSKQTKWYGVNLTLSSTKPSRSHYSFLGWSTSSSAASASYSEGGSYTDNASATLYAVWKGNTYTITYNANGGTGAPSKQSYTYASSGSVNLSSTEPTRTNYNFLGWARSSSATSAEYSAGQAWAKSNGANHTLYAVWELAYTAPRITNVVVERANSSGTHADDGTYFNVSFDWETDKTVSSVAIYWGSNTETISASGTSGTVTSNALGSGSISTELSYVITITVADSTGSSSTTRTIPAMAYTIDFLSGGKGVAIGKPASKENAVDIAWPVYDQYGDLVANGMSVYLFGGEDDPNTTTNHLILTKHSNGPVSGYFFYIMTFFYADKSKYKSQIAIPYNTSTQKTYFRYCYNGTWVSWRKSGGSDMYDENTLTTSLQSYAASCNAGHSKVALGGASYTGNDLPAVNGSAWNYGTALINVRGSSSKSILLISENGDLAIGYGYSASTGAWTGWKTYLSDAGGTMTGELNVTNRDNYLGKFYFYNDYIGIYNSTSRTTRLAYFGMVGTKDFIVLNQAGDLQVGTRLFSSASSYGCYTPYSDNTVYLGHSSYRWKQLIAYTSTISTSDRAKKKDFAKFDERYENLFFDLKPTLYRFIENESNRIHSGFISQDVEESLESNGLTALDFAAFCKDKAKNIEHDEDGNDVLTDKLDENGNQVYDYSLRYEEFIALNTHMLQKAYAKIDEQQAQIDSLQAQIDELKQLLTSK